MKTLANCVLLSLALGSGTTFAKCLDRPDVDPKCRYPQGDIWCAEHDKFNPYAYSNKCLINSSENIKENNAIAIQPVISDSGNLVIPPQFHGQWEESEDACETGSDTYFTIGEKRVSTAAHQCVLGKVKESNFSFFLGVFHCNMENIVEYDEEYKIEIRNGTLVVNENHIFFHCK